MSPYDVHFGLISFPYSLKKIGRLVDPNNNVRILCAVKLTSIINDLFILKHLISNIIFNEVHLYQWHLSAFFFMMYQPVHHLIYILVVSI